MFTRPPDVADGDVVAALADGWCLDASTVAYLAVGFGSHHWRAATATGDWFVTVDDLVAKRREADEPLSTTRARLLSALATAAAVRDAGYEFAVAPRPSDDGRVACDLGDRYVVAVYPLVDGQAYDYGVYTDDSHRDAVVAVLATLHGSPASCRRWAMTDTFSIARRADLSEACAHLTDRWDAGPFADPARRLLAEHAHALTRAFDRYDRLAPRVRARAEGFVLTHGEPHPANTIVTERGVVLVDWDTALIAPPERDLWDLIGDEPSVADQYTALTGTPVDDDAIEMYRLAWDLSEIALYVSDFRQPHDRTDDTAEAWQNLQHFLDPTRW